MGEGEKEGTATTVLRRILEEFVAVSQPFFFGPGPMHYHTLAGVFVATLLQGKEEHKSVLNRRYARAALGAAAPIPSSHWEATMERTLRTMAEASMSNVREDLDSRAVDVGTLYAWCGWIGR